MGGERGVMRERRRRVEQVERDEQRGRCDNRGEGEGEREEMSREEGTV